MQYALDQSETRSLWYPLQTHASHGQTEFNTLKVKISRTTSVLKRLKRRRGKHYTTKPPRKFVKACFIYRTFKDALRHDSKRVWQWLIAVGILIQFESKSLFHRSCLASSLAIASCLMFNKHPAAASCNPASSEPIISNNSCKIETIEYVGQLGPFHTNAFTKCPLSSGRKRSRIFLFFCTSVFVSFPLLFPPVQSKTLENYEGDWDLSCAW